MTQPGALEYQRAGHGPYARRGANLTARGNDRAADYPRVVVVSANPLRRDLASGIAMRSLFADWPKDRLAQIYLPAAVPYPPEMDVCREYRMIRTCGLVRRFQQAEERPLEINREDAAQKRPAAASWPGRLARKVRNRRGLNRWARLLQEGWYAYSWVGKVLERELRGLKPDIVLAMMGNWCLTKITCAACERLAVPLYLKTNDDFVEALYRDVPFSAKVRALSDRWYRRAVNSADGLATISPVMSEEFARRYGKKWDWFTTLIDADDYDPAPRRADGTVRLTYAGNLGLERWRTLRELALALKQLGENHALDVHLAIYSSPSQTDAHRRALDVPPVTELRGWAAPEDLPRIFHGSDILVHVESFAPDMADITRLSFSTKLSQYMMAGRCVLMVGPHDGGSAKMVRLTGAGITVGSIDPKSLQAALHPVLAGAPLRADHANQGRLWALQWFEAQAGRERFRRTVVEALRRSAARANLPTADTRREMEAISCPSAT